MTSTGKMLVLIGVAAYLAGCVTSPYLHQKHPLVSKIYDPAAKRFISEESLHLLIHNADFLLLGEVHDNPIHHQFQAQAVREYFRSQTSPEVAVFEQIHTGQEKALRALQNLPRQGPQILRDLLEWETSGWPPFAIYEPIFEALIDREASIAAGLYPPPQVKTVYREGMRAVVDEQAIDRYRLDELPVSAQERLQQIIEDSHCGLIDAKHAVPMVQVQMSKDAFMAMQLVAERKEGKAVLIAGNGHTRKDFGVPQYLAKLEPRAKIVSVAVLEVQPDLRDPDKYLNADIADFVFFTPAWDRQDPCEAMVSRKRE